jgi:[CysO sulfur-carrier protein]-S-L-cysteine hydrolase
MAMLISQSQLDIMIEHARAGLPNEACGLLAGAGDVVGDVYCLENAHRSPSSYELTGAGYLRLVELADSGLLLASFHSHTQSEAYPSATDRRQAYWAIRYVILSLRRRSHPVVRVFRITKKDVFDPGDLGEVTEEELEVLPHAGSDA